jgi:hypothetical protein
MNLKAMTYCRKHTRSKIFELFAFFAAFAGKSDKADLFIFIENKKLRSVNVLEEAHLFLL